MTNDDPRLTKLEAELKSARQEYEDDYNPQPKEIKGLNDGARAGVELVGALIGGGALGYGIDYAFNTSPIFFFIFLIWGVITGFYSIYKITMGTGTSVGFKGLKNTSKNAKQEAILNKEDESSHN